MSLSSRQEILVFLGVLNLVLSTTFVALRLYVRVRIRAFSYDDFAIFATQVVNIACTSELFLGVSRGFGLMDVDLPIKSYQDIWNVNYSYVAFFLLWTSVMWLIKISVCLSLLRFTVEKLKKAIIYALMAIVTAITIINMSLTLTSCRPVKALYTGVGKCVPMSQVLASAYFNVISTIVTDIIVAALPYFMLRHLQMNRKTKRTLLFILSIGIITSFATIARLFFVHGYAAYTDRDYVIFPTMCINLVECAVGISTACAPTLKPLFKTFSERSTVVNSENAQQSMSRSRKLPLSSVTEDTASEEEEGGIRMTSQFDVREERRSSLDRKGTAWHASESTV